MSNSQNAPVHGDNGLGFHGENDSIVALGVDVPPINPGEVSNAEPVDISSHIALNADLGANPGASIRMKVRSGGQRTHGVGDGGINLQVIFEMLQAQHIAIAQLQSHNKTPSVDEPKNTRRIEHVPERSNENSSGTNPTIMRMLEELTKRIESEEKRTEDNDKKWRLKTPVLIKYQGHPGLERFGRQKVHTKVVPSECGSDAHLQEVPHADIPKYNGTTNPNEHVTSYICGIKVNDLNDDEIESVLLKEFGKTLSKGAMIWYHNLPLNSIDSFSMLMDALVKAHAGAIKVATRKSDVLKIKQRNDEMLREFVSRFQMERMELPPVSDDWAVQTFIQGLNERSSIASRKLKQNLIEYTVVTWSDVHNRYQSKIRVEDDQLGAPQAQFILTGWQLSPRGIQRGNQDPTRSDIRQMSIGETTARVVTLLRMIGETIEVNALGDS